MTKILFLILQSRFNKQLPKLEVPTLRPTDTELPRAWTYTLHFRSRIKIFLSPKTTSQTQTPPMLNLSQKPDLLLLRRRTTRRRDLQLAISSLSRVKSSSQIVLDEWSFDVSNISSKVHILPKRACAALSFCFTFDSICSAPTFETITRDAESEQARRSFSGRFNWWDNMELGLFKCTCSFE